MLTLTPIYEIEYRTQVDNVDIMEVMLVIYSTLQSWILNITNKDWGSIIHTGNLKQQITFKDKTLVSKISRDT